MRFRLLHSIRIVTSFSLGGCTGGAGIVIGAAAPVISDAIQPLPGRRTPSDTAGLGALAGRAQRDDGRFWMKEIVGPDGASLSLARARAGDPIEVRWRVPFTVSGGVQAVAGVADQPCLAQSIAEPASWSLEADGGAPREAWWVGWVPAPTRRVLGRLQAEALGIELGIGRRHRIAWLLVVPAPGSYRLVVRYASADADQVLDAVPCLNAWLPVPLGAAIGATMAASAPPVPAPVAPARPLPSRFAPTQPAARSRFAFGTGRDSAPSAAAGGLAIAATVDSLPLRVAPASAIDAVPADVTVMPDPLAVIRQTYTLLDTPSYDLARLYQVALGVELAPLDVPPLAPADAVVAVHAWRARQLARLATPANRGEVCLLILRPGLADRPLALWGGEPTIPAPLRDACRGGEAP